MCSTQKSPCSFSRFYRSLSIPIARRRSAHFSDLALRLLQRELCGVYFWPWLLHIFEDSSSSIHARLLIFRGPGVRFLSILAYAWRGAGEHAQPVGQQARHASTSHSLRSCPSLCVRGPVRAAADALRSCRLPSLGSARTGRGD